MANCFRDALPRVANRDGKYVLGLRGCDHNPATPFNGIQSIGKQIHQDLVDPTCVACEFAYRSIVFFDFDPALDLVLKKQQYGIDAFMDIDCLELPLVQARKRAQFENEFLDSLQPLSHTSQACPNLLDLSH